MPFTGNQYMYVCGEMNILLEALDDLLHVSDRLVKSLVGSYLTVSINPPWIKLCIYIHVQNAFLTHKVLTSRDNFYFIIGSKYKHTSTAYKKVVFIQMCLCS